MSEPTGCADACPASCYCRRCDLLVGLDGFHVVRVLGRVGRRGPFLRVEVESAPAVQACRACGVVAFATAAGRSGWSTSRAWAGQRRPNTAPSSGRTPFNMAQRTWRCSQSSCPAGTVTEQCVALARPRALLTRRACWWAVGQVRREHASVQGLARQLGTTWRTVWASIAPLLKRLAEDETWFEGVTALGGVDEHVVRHEALLFRMEVKDLHRRAVAAVG